MSMENLIELQGIDTKLKDLNDLLGDLPSKVEGLNQQEESIKHSLQSNKNRLKELEVELHKKEVSISQLDGKVESLKDQLFLVTNNKQYDALMKEIDHLKDKKSTFESETIELLEEKEKLIQDVESMESDLTGLSDDLSKRRLKLETAISQSADEKSILEKEKQARIDKIDLNIMSVYDKVMDARGGLAVVPIVGSGCGGCGAHIPPQTLTEVRANTGIHRCDICGRFLYNQEKVVN
jgi:predicted  nucleic acid-binding Zn-ribbon protein